MNNKIVLESLSMDLLRVALGLHRGSTKMVNRFTEEALKRNQEVDKNSVKPYVKILLSNMEKALQDPNREKRAEDALMYSVLFKNYCVTFLK